MDKREELIIKLNHIILIKGFQKSSMATLAKNIGISRASLYLYFKNKDEIIQAVVNRHLEFIKNNQFNDTDNPDDLTKALLNTMLLTGSSTTTFENELRDAYPQLFVEFQNSYEDYFNKFSSFYKSMQKKKYFVENISAEFVVFQNKATINEILKQTLNDKLAINHAENFLNEYFISQLNSIVEPVTREQMNLQKIEGFKKSIITEFRTTYSLSSR
ncbi:TetR/AcrR family transcriptional regulator [Companilactobacillus jidongensis]|uniref:TetR/AcrR family transcriptional regulator n=1 Tax=Companilactobacillus jidongensis TaxID=2486006 RepID=UPI000F791D7F|nr:TetR/AcrR family transcriptional regulator [Companilactobacillus jidongensis]